MIHPSSDMNAQSTFLFLVKVLLSLVSVLLLLVCLVLALPLESVGIMEILILVYIRGVSCHWCCTTLIQSLPLPIGMQA
jgi:hypothetical protein